MLFLAVGAYEEFEHFLMESGTAPELGRCDSCVIRDCGICNALTREELDQFRQIANRRIYRPGAFIMSSDDETEFFAAVYSGVVKLAKILADGRQQVVSLLLPPDCLGRAYDKKGQNNFYIAEAATEVELCCFPRAGFEQMLEHFSGMKQRLLEQIMDDLDLARDWMVLLGRKTAEERMASLLLMLATRSTPFRDVAMPASPPVEFELHLKRDEIADFLGLSYETVCRQITALKKKGIVELDGTRRFTVPDLDALAKVAAIN